MSDEPSGRTFAVDAIYEVLLQLSLKEDGWPPRLTITHPRTIAAIVCSEMANAALAAVYGDIVEAARRDALRAAARVIGDEAAADGVYGTDVQSGLLRAGWIVGNMARHGLSASVSDQGADPRTPTTPGTQIAAEGRNP